MKFTTFLCLVATLLVTFNNVNANVDSNINDNNNKSNKRNNDALRTATHVSKLLISSSSSSRRLSAWSSFLHFVSCPPGPLSNTSRCKNYKSNNGSGGGGDNGGGGGGNGSSSYSWSSGSNSNGGGGGGEGGSRSWTNWWSGGSGNNGGGGGAEDGGGYSGASIAHAGSFPWFVMVFSLVGLATGGGYLAYQSSKNEDGIASAATLKNKITTFIQSKTGGGASSTSANNEYKLSQDGAVLA